VVCTGGDYLSELVQLYDTGRVVDFGDSEQLARVIIEAATDENFQAQARQNIIRFRDEMLWSKALEPLDKFCDHAYLTVNRSAASLGRLTVDITWWLMLKAVFQAWSLLD